nr:uroporphyrinogen-III synthase [Sphingomonas insulae]
MLVVRPEPGNARTVVRLRAGGGRDVIAWPLFAPAPVPWEAPDPARHDALLVTSANAMRLGGAGLARLTGLPVIAVGAETAAAATAAGFRVATIGDGGVDAALAAGRATGLERPLHLAGREHVDSGHPTVIVYASADVSTDAAAFAAAAGGRIVLLHSERAAMRVATLLPGRREAIGIAALSAKVRTAAGDGWGIALTADVPRDAALCSLVLQRAIDRAADAGDKRP